MTNIKQKSSKEVANLDASRIELDTIRQGGRQSTTSPTGDATETLWNNKNLIGPRIFHFGSGGVTAHIDVPTAAIKRTENVARLLRDRLCSRKLRLGI